MTARKQIGRALNFVLRRAGFQLVSTAQGRVVGGNSRVPVALTAEAEEYLRPDNPRLLELQRRYAAMDPRVTSPDLWKHGHINAYETKYFRGDNAYIWQLRGGESEASYALTAYYLQSIDRLGLLDRFREDGSFGAHTFGIGGRTVSRDLLDSAAEIYFLDKALGIPALSGMRVLDIGAGYGRLAWRMTSALDGIAEYLCTDAVPLSSFICEYYLGFRGGSRMRMVPLDEVEADLSSRPVDLAINVHSFSECTVPAVTWWLELLQRKKVRYLMIVPNAQRTHGGAAITTNKGHDLMPVIERCGFRLLAKEPKYRDSAVQRNGVQATFHYLFEAQG